MSRSALLDLLPDFSEGRRRGPPPRAPGFEPLVQDAGEREGFSTLGMSSGFTGISPEPDFGGASDPFSMEGDLMAGIDLAGEDMSLDLPDMNLPEDGDLALGLSTEEPADLVDAPPGMDMAADDAAFPPELDSGLSALDEPSEEPEEAASGIAAHELLEAAHRAEINDIETAHRKEIEELVATRLPNIRSEVADAIASEIAPLLAQCLRTDHVSRTLEVLTAEIAAALEDSEAVGFELHGPDDLLAAFRERWPDDAAPARLVSAPGLDIVARVGKTVLATRLAEVDKLIQEALS